jgi:competence ComEA-like helix-hairpin-helix protein
MYRFTILLLLTTLCSFAADDKADEENRKLLTKVCGGCHKLDIVTNHRGNKDQWRATIEAMVIKGADATDDEFNAIIDYLAKHYGPDRPVEKLNVNSATADQISGFFALSDTEAAAIVKRRESTGKFKSLQELTSIPGVDAKKIQAKKDLITY